MATARPSASPRSGSTHGSSVAEENEMVSIKQSSGSPATASKLAKREKGGSIITFLFNNFQCMNSTRLMVLVVLCLQNSLFTVLRRYSQGVLREHYSKHEVLLVGEVIKIVYSAWMISEGLPLLSSSSSGGVDSIIEPPSAAAAASNKSEQLVQRLKYLVLTSRKMFMLALIYGAMNILSFVALRNVSAAIFTIVAQCKIITTATFSTIILRRKYSWNKWRALISLMLGVLLFSSPIWLPSMTGDTDDGDGDDDSIMESGGNPIFGTLAVVTEVILSGFASIYFEKVIKTDPLKLNIWERNFQLALGSFPVYIAFITFDTKGRLITGGLFHGWSFLALVLSILGAAGGLLVALSIKYGDSVLKTFATSGAIIISSIIDHLLLGGPLTPVMIIAGAQVIIAICNYTFDPTPTPAAKTSDIDKEDKEPLLPASREKTSDMSSSSSDERYLTQRNSSGGV